MSHHLPLSIVILAAGQGKRMYSDLPKVLHPLAGKPLLAHVVDTANQLSPDALYVVVGHHQETICQVLGNGPQWVHQSQPLGTGHAVLQAMPHIPNHHRVLVLYGDVPLIGVDTLRALCQAPDEAVALLTVMVENPAGYGRIVRDEDGQIRRIVEQKDASPTEQNVREINTGIILAPAAALRGWLSFLRNDNAQGEYYLTDIVGLAVNQGVSVLARQPQALEEVLGVNDRVQLARLERWHQQNIAEKLMRQGVTILDPMRFDVRGELQCGRDVVIDVNAVIEGQVQLGERVFVGPNCYLRNVQVAADTQIFANSVIDSASIGAHCRIGPFARIRPETCLADRVHVGNFVEIKKSTISHSSKINHLSYIGDTEMGQEVNIGAGTITCNYDGANKHKTVIEDRVFIGSDSQLVAPVTIAQGSTIGAGSTITHNTPAEMLTLSRVAQQSLPGWKRPSKSSPSKKKK